MVTLEKIVNLCKRRGIIFPGSEIYGGLAGTYDYGPLGVELNRNIKEAWRREMFQLHSNIFGVDSSILMQRRVWEASGHTSAGFTDPLQECKKCHHRFRADHLTEQRIAKCPDCGGELTEPKRFNLLVETHLGPVKDDASLTYLRGETTQGIYVNYRNIKTAVRAELPFGIGQIGKAFRNEITPGHFIYRMREFEQMEMQYFVRPEEADKYFDHWKEERLKWYLALGMKKENLRFRPHAKDELAHYARAAEDIEYNFPFGWHEIEGIHNRGDWDLSRHSEFSGEDLSETDPKTDKKFYPYIIETSAGADRLTLAFLIDAYNEIVGGRTTTTKSTKDVEVVLRLHKKLAPVKVAVLPLSKKDQLIKAAKEILFDLKRAGLVTDYDDTQSIGRRYRRQDEIGTPYCITFDFESVNDQKVTVRDRDSM
ncbi:MAG: glycine--tRNA ligase, partial [Candidatus Doudnabacteria bacterium]|nr:glycine--tRNA ligase [Candidatus Doudnabacteria bacterium]